MASVDPFGRTPRFAGGRALLAVLLTVYLAVPSQAQLGDSPWPSYHGDAQNTRLSSARGPAEPVTKWVYEGSAGPISISPDGSLYFYENDSLTALTPSGDTKWIFGGDSVEVAAQAPAIGKEGTIYVSGDRLYALTPSGVRKWSVSGRRRMLSAPNVGPDGTIYVGSADSSVYAIRPSGTVDWTFGTTAKVRASITVGPAGQVYLGGGDGDGNLYALSAEGSLQWRWSPPTEGYVEYNSTDHPSVGSNGTTYVAEERLYALNPDGSIHWSVQREGTANAHPALGPRSVLYTYGDLHITSYFLDGELNWRTEQDRLSRPLAIGSNGTIYSVLDSSGTVGGSSYLIALDSRDGTLMWSHSLGKVGLQGGPVIGVDRTVYVPTEDGLYAIGDAAVTSTPEHIDSRPDRISLGHNYPNPFNPVTVIPYELPIASDVRLVVFDLLGRRVRVVTAGDKPAGHHVARLRAGDLPSGTYLYRLSADGTVQERAMTIVK